MGISHTRVRISTLPYCQLITTGRHTANTRTHLCNRLRTPAIFCPLPPSLFYTLSSAQFVLSSVQVLV